MHTEPKAVLPSSTSSRAAAGETPLMDVQRWARVAALCAVVVVLEHQEGYQQRSSLGIRTLYLQAERGERLTAVLYEQPKRMLRFTRLLPGQLDSLLSLTTLEDGRIVSARQKLVIFLHLLATGCRYRVLMELFQHSGATVHEVFHEVLPQVVSLHRQFVRPATAESMEQQLSAKGGRYWPWFRGAVGALDGSHVPAFVRGRDAANWRNRKGLLTQNVLAVVDFDGRFTFVLAGWEGSAHDSRVLAAAKDSETDQLSAPEDCFYLADAGYSNTPTTLVPYRGVRYHLQEQYAARQRPQTKEELFNLRHASLRNVVERVFGVLKTRFQLFQRAPQFSLEVQCRLVYAATALHNFLIEYSEAEEQLEELLEQPAVDAFQVDFQAPEGSQAARGRRDQSGGMTAKREMIAEAMWKSYQEHLMLIQP